MLGFALVAYTALLFGFRYLPMVDLPQHAAQLSAWVHMHDPSYRFAEQFEVNYRTPYLIGYLLARPFVPLLGVVGALKATIVIALVATLSTFRSLVRALGHDEWTCLFALPASLGVSFHFGFVSFLMATPLVLVCAQLALRRIAEPTRPSAALLGGLSVLATLTHGLSLAALLLLCSSVVIARTRQHLVRTLWPIAVPVLLILPWLPGFIVSGGGVPHPERWGVTWYRIGSFPGNLVGCGFGDRLATYFGVLLVVVLGVTAGRPRRVGWSWLPLAAVLLCYALFPFQLRKVGFLYHRFAWFLLPALLVAWDPARRVLRAPLARTLAVLVGATWLALSALRFEGFNREASGFDVITRSLPMGLRLRPLMVLNASDSCPGCPVFLHFPAYYQAEKGGFLGASFAANYTSFVRYKPGVHSGMRPGAEWHPERFDAALEVPDYDVFIVRADREYGPLLFHSSPLPIRREASSGMWWLYSVVRP